MALSLDLSPLGVLIPIEDELRSLAIPVPAAPLPIASEAGASTMQVADQMIQQTDVRQLCACSPVANHEKGAHRM